MLCSRSAQKFQRNPSDSLDEYLRAELERKRRCRCRRLRTLSRGQSALAINHQGQFPAVTISFNLAPGKSIGDAVTAVNKAKAGPEYAAERERAVPGIGGGF